MHGCKYRDRKLTIFFGIPFTSREFSIQYCLARVTLMAVHFLLSVCQKVIFLTALIVWAMGDNTKIDIQIAYLAPTKLRNLLCEEFHILRGRTQVSI
jgi:hypothetical protein